MKTSLIIPSYNGIKKLHSVLEAIKEQTHPPDELIIVLDGSTDGTKEWIDKNFSFPGLQVIEQKNGGRACARNTGVRHATGELLIFIDDDIKVMPDFTEAHIAMHNKYPYSLCSGTVCQDITAEQHHDFLCFRAFIEKKWIKHISIEVYKGFCFSTSQLSIEKSTFEQIGYFDERLSDSEDFDFGVRAVNKNIPIYFNSNIKALHQDFASLEQYIKRHIEYNKSKKHLLALHPEYRKAYAHVFLPETSKNFLVKSMRFFLCYNEFWKFIIDNHFFRKLIPQYFRFKLYDLIISSTVLKENV